jgi:hypothetical protein
MWKWQKQANFLEKLTFGHVGTKCHSKVGWKICGQNVTDFGTKYYNETVLSHCDKLSKFTRSECRNLGQMDNPSNLRQNVTVLNCHSRRSERWMVCLVHVVSSWVDGSLRHPDLRIKVLFNCMKLVEKPNYDLT